MTTPLAGTGQGGAQTMAAADFNGDGKTDLALTTGDGLVDIALGAVGGLLTPAGSLVLPTGHQAIGVIALDYNGDGKPDLVVEGQSRCQIIFTAWSADCKIN